ncbi:MAG: hypothetical protein KAR87_03480 [Candidatus Aenigmarchaeota archaeon]|nr:hypothetical protein [Candidatus Aenigmarchaeota archaeon]
MDFLLPLTIIGFVISIYQISEEYKKRNFVFKINWIDKALFFIFAVFLVCSIFLQNFYLIQEQEPIFRTFNCNSQGNCYDITYSYLFSIIAFLLAVILIICFIIKLNSKKLSKKKEFINNALDMLSRQKYDELSADLELFHDELLKHYKRPKQRNFYFLKYFQYILSEYNKVFKQSKQKSKFIIILKKTSMKMKSYSKYKKESQENFTKLGHMIRFFEPKKPIWQIKLTKLIEKLQFMKNSRIKYCDMIDDFYYELINNTDFLEYITMNNTDLMFKLLDNKLNYRKEEVWSVIGTKLIRDKNSKLWKELHSDTRNNTKIINFLFNDTRKSEQWWVWKPIGDYVLQYLREQKRKAVDEENYYEENYDDMKYKSPIYTGIRYFNVMIMEALKQNNSHHMWIFYLQYWTRKIVKNIKYEDEKPAEFKNMYEYFLYQIFEIYMDCIRYIIENDDYTVKFKPKRGPNMIQNAISSFIVAMKCIYESNIRNNAKTYFRELFIDSYFELASHHNQKKIGCYVDYFRQQLRNEIVDSTNINKRFIAFIKVPIENYRDRSIWYKGISYPEEVRQEFVTFLNSLNNIQKEIALK